METITIIQYKAFDGTLLSSKKSCTAYEKDKKALDKIEKILGKRYIESECSFANGCGYIQHHMCDVTQCWIQLLMFIKHKNINDEDINKQVEYCLNDINIGPNYSMLGRFIDGGICWNLYTRLMCIDFKTGREYGQPYYALNPDKSTGSEIKR